MKQNQHFEHLQIYIFVGSAIQKWLFSLAWGKSQLKKKFQAPFGFYNFAHSKGLGSKEKK